MKSQIIISIGREHGSGGHYIAQILAEHLGIKLYDNSFIHEIAEASGYTEEDVISLDEKPVNFLTSRRVGQYSNSPEVAVAEHTLNIIRSAAESGSSFVVVGRSAESVLRGSPNWLSLFIRGEEEDKIQRLMKTDNVNRARAKDIMRACDKRRRTYHDYYCGTAWGDPRYYDLVVNSSRLGIEKTAEALAQYARVFQSMD